MSGPLRASVDSDVCIGTGYCEATAPELFEVTDEGTARVLVDEIPDELADRARQAAADCPTRALKVEQGVGG